MIDTLTTAASMENLLTTFLGDSFINARLIHNHI